MNRLAIAAVLVTAMGQAASAGTYVGLGLGTSANASSDNVMMDGNGRSGRLMLGYRFSRIAIEGSGTRYDLFVGSAPYQATQLAAGLKLAFPLGNHFDLIGRGGLQRTSLSMSGSQGADADGNGYYLGAGVEYGLNLGLTGASIFIDYQRSSTDFDNGNRQYEGVASMWTLGATLSL